MSFLAKTGLTLANVKDYGAQGDGTTDDTAPIQAAINSAIADGLGGVFFPPGQYQVSQVTGLSIASATDFRFVGAGTGVSLLQVIGEDHDLGPWSLLRLTGGCSQVSLSDFAIDGNKSAVTNPDTNDALIDTGDTSNLEARNLFLQNSDGRDFAIGDGVTLAERISIHDCRLLDSSGIVFDIDLAAQVVIANNNVIQATEVMEFVHLSAGANKDVDIRDNHLENNDNNWNGIVIESVDRCDISRNKMLGGADGATNGIQVLAAAGGVFCLSVRENQILAALTNSISITPTVGNVGRVSIQNNELTDDVRMLAGAGSFTELPVISGNSGAATSILPVADLANLPEPAVVIAGKFNRGGATANGGSTLLGDGDPEGVITASPGDMFLSQGGGVGTTLYVKETGAGFTGWVKATGDPGGANRITVSTEPGYSDYTSIKDAVDAAVAAGASTSNPYHVIVSGGTYTESPFTMAAGVFVASDVSVGAGSVIIDAADPTNDLVTFNGGSFNAITFQGVTTAGKALLRSANPAALTTLFYCNFQKCAIGWCISGATAAGSVLAANIIAPGLQITEHAIRVELGGRLSLLGAFFSVPAALLPAYAVNPIENAIVVDGVGSSANISGASFDVAPKNSTQINLIAGGGAQASLLSSAFLNGETGISIDAAGSGTRVILGATRMEGHTTKLECLSSTGIYNAVLVVDTRSESLVAGSTLDGIITETGSGISTLVGMTLSDFGSGRAIELDEFFFDTSSSGVHNYAAGASGVVTDGGGLFVDVGAGSAFIRRESDEDLIYTTWVAVTGLAITPSVTNYISVDAATLAVVTATAPPSSESALLAIVVATGTGVRYIHTTPQPVNNGMARVHQYLLQTRKFAANTGAALSQGSGATKVTISSGSYYRGLSLLSVAGGVDKTFSYFYNAGATEVASQTDLDTTDYDNAGTLTAMTAGFFRTDSVVLTSDNRLSIIYGTAEFSSSLLAQDADFATIPTFLQETGLTIAKIVVEQGVGIDTIIDVRPQPSGAGSVGGAGVSDHSLLSNLGADDHTQYLLVSGARAMTGNLDLGGNSVINVNLVDGVNVPAHAARHQPGGVDAIPTAIATAIVPGDVAAIGAAASVSNSGHKHSLPPFGTGVGEFCQGNDARLSNSRTPTGAAGGDLSGTYPNPAVAALAITDAKVAAANKDGAAGTPSMRTLGTGAAQACAGNDARLSDSRAPNGTAGGDLSGTYPNPAVGTNAVSNAKLAQMAANTVKVNDTGGGPTNPVDLNMPASTILARLATGNIVPATPAQINTLLGTGPAGLLQTVANRITVDTTSSSITFVTLLSQAITTVAGSALMIHFAAGLSNSTNNGQIIMEITVDGARACATGYIATGAGVPGSLAMSRKFTGLAAGAHTVLVRWRMSGGTGRIRPVTAPESESASLMMYEVAV